MPLLDILLNSITAEKVIRVPLLRRKFYKSYYNINYGKKSVHINFGVAEHFTDFIVLQITVLKFMC